MTFWDMEDNVLKINVKTVVKLHVLILVIACLHNAITMQNREAGTRSVCSPAHRWRQCWHHCSQILVARLLLFLTSHKDFRHKLCERQQLKSLIQLLEPTLDPVSLYKHFS